MRPAIALVAALALLVGGCGKDKPNDNDQITAAVKAYYKAFGDGDSRAACDKLASGTKEELVKAGGGKGCPAILEGALKRPDYAKVAPKLASVQVSAVTVAGDKATVKATVPGVGKTVVVPLEKEGGSWKIASPVGE